MWEKEQENKEIEGAKSYQLGAWAKTSKNSKGLECPVLIKSRNCDQVLQATLKRILISDFTNFLIFFN